MNYRRQEYSECGSTAESCEGDEYKAGRLGGVERRVCRICGEPGDAEDMDWDEDGYFHKECRE